MVLIYSTKESSRLNYVLDFIFSELLLVRYKLTLDESLFTNFPGPKINYSLELKPALSIYPDKLLFENGIEDHAPAFESKDDVPLLYPTFEPGFFPFDIFSATFYMISRYEEYLDRPKDKHGRVEISQMMAVKNNFYHKPVVDIWGLMLKKEIELRYPDYSFPQKSYRFIPTIDVDIAYAYKYRNVFRILGANLKAIIKGDIADLSHRFQTLALRKEDPYDVFDLLSTLFIQKKINPRFFFLLGNYGKFDKNLSPKHPAMKNLILKTRKAFDVGIHPSYESCLAQHQLEKEVLFLENLLQEKVTMSRQHFLKLNFPETYHQLISLGIQEDYTMGCAAKPGFRAGTCTPFLFYDLTRESVSSLKIFPFQVMDGTLNQYMKLLPEDAIRECKKLIDEVRKVNGTFISLWHNESLSEMHGWKGWKKVFFQMVEEAL